MPSPNPFGGAAHGGLSPGGGPPRSASGAGPQSFAWPPNANEASNASSSEILRPQRKPRGGPPPVHTPLKTTGHNSKPSISLAPAAFASALAEHNANKIKRKIVVSLPKECPDHTDEGADPEQARQTAEDAARSEGKDEEVIAKKGRQAAAAVLVRRVWSQRRPLELYDFVSSTYSLFDHADLCTSVIYPEPASYLDDLPDTIDIYLPGQAAWLDYKEMREEEKQREAELKHERPSQLLSDIALQAHDARSAASSPTGSSAAASRVEQFVNDQSSMSGGRAQEDHVQDISTFRFGGSTDSAQKPSRHESGKRHPETPTRNEKTMSLSVPSSGGPFASAALIAMGIPSPDGQLQEEEEQDSFDQPERETHSDGEVFGDAKERPVALERSDSAPGRSTLPQRPLETADKPSEHVSKPSWKDLGAGFGYELEDVAEESSSAMHSRDPSRQLRDLDHEIEEDLRTNPSEDADASDVGDDNDVSRTWQPTISIDEQANYGSEVDSFQYSDSLSESDEDVEYSNPSDEEAALQAREQRKALRSERKAARAIARSRTRDHATLAVDEFASAGGRPRANTADTFASSSLHPEGEYGASPQGRRNSVHRGGRWSAGHAASAKVNSNPSDDEDEDIGDSTAGPAHATPSQHNRGISFGTRNNGPIDGPNSPEGGDYRFPSAAATTTIGRAAATRVASGLNPAAKEFVFGAGPQSGPTDVRQSYANPEQHYRLPSIPSSSFGGSAFGRDLDGTEQQRQPIQSRQVSAGCTVLNANAPAFNPRSTFTFAAPSGAPRPPQPFIGGYEEVQPEILREEQGREKRSRTKVGGPDASNTDITGSREIAYRPSEPLDQGNLDDSPDHAAPERSMGENGRNQAGPSNEHGLAGDFGSRRPSGLASLRPSAPSFMPTSARQARQARPGIPMFDGPQDVGGSDAEVPGLMVPTSDFTFSMDSKAIPIRAPEGWRPRNEAASERPALSAISTEDEEDRENQPQPISTSGNATKILGDGSVRRKPLGNIANESNRGAINIPGSSATHPRADVNLRVAAGGQDARPRRSSRLAQQHGQSYDLRSNGSSTASARIRGDDVDSASDGESETFQDIIDELASRMDQSLDAWGGRILDEVTLAGQVRPLMSGHTSHASTIARVSEDDRSSIVNALLDGVKTALAQQLSQFQDTFVEQQKQIGFANAPAIDVRADRLASTGEARILPRSRKDGSGADSLDTRGDGLDFDYVAEVLEDKIGSLKRDMLASMTVAQPKTLSTDADIARPAAMGSDELANAVLQRLQPLFQSTRDELSERQRADLPEILHPLLMNAFAKVVAESESNREAMAKSLVESIEGRMRGWEKNLVEMREHMPEHVQVALINGIIPHLDAFITKPEPQLHIAGSDPDVVAARVTEILAPMISESRETRRERQISEDEDRQKELERDRQAMNEVVEAATAAAQAAADSIAKQSSLDPDTLAEAVLKKILPDVAAIKTEPVDTQQLIASISDVIGKQSIEHLVDLNPVTALLEPLVAKQEDVRSLSQKIMSRQRELESTLSDMPTLVGAKVEALYSAYEHRETSGDVLELQDMLQQLLNKVEATQSETQGALEQARQEAMEQKTEATEIRAELIAAGSYSSTLKDEVSRLEKSADDLLEQIRLLRDREAEATEKARNSERQATEADYRVKDLEASRDGAIARCELLATHNDELANELKASREERARERESAAQATAEVLARLVSAERAVAEANQRAEEKERQESESRTAKDAALQEALERAARAEGELSGLQKRVADQDVKVSNLQSLAAAQKQKAAETQQKLSEASKKREEYESQAQEHAIALARLKDMESRLVDEEALHEKVRAVEEDKAHLREELSQYHQRFLEVERDLVGMKDRLVGREQLEACQEELATSREETAQLRGQLAERERQEEQRRADEEERMARSKATRIAWDDPSESSYSASLHRGANGDGERGTLSSSWAGGGSSGEGQDGDDTTASSSLTTDGGFAMLRKPSSRGATGTAPAIVVSSANMPVPPSYTRTSSNRVVQKTDDGWWS